MKIVRLRRSKVKFSSAYKKRTYQETFECCCILHYWDRQFRTSTEITTSMKIEITRDVELIAQQVSIKCYLAIFTDVVIFGEFEGGFSE